MEETENKLPKHLISFKHSGNCGDIIYAMPSIGAVCKKYNKKAVIFLRLHTKANYYENAVHPLGNLMLNRYMFDMIKPLLMAQDYVEDVLIHSGDTIMIDCDIFRQESVGLPYGSISKWLCYSYPDMHCDLGERWLNYIPNEDISDLVKNSIILNFTERYRNQWIDYKFLNYNHLKLPLLFVGTDKEAAMFKEQVPRIKHLKVDNFNELAAAIDNCKFFMGNQSMCYAIAEGLKKDRVLEICSFAPNVITYGANGYDFYKQNALQYYVEQLAEGKRP